MLGSQQSSRCLMRKSERAVFPAALGLVSIVLLFSVQTTVAAQQSGAVPLTQGIADLASQLAKSIPEGHLMTIAVTDFPEKKQVCGLGQFVAERLSTLLSRQPQCHLIERHRLDQVLQELKFSMSELVDPAKARRLGQMLGVQGLVVGTVTDLGTTFDIDARIIDIQTDVSLPGTSASVVKDDTVRSLSADCISGGMPSVGPSSPGPASAQLLRPKSRPQASVARVVVRDFVFEAKSCKMRETTVTCNVVITNLGDDRELDADGYNVGWHRPVRMIDDSGNEYRAQKLRLGSSANNEGVEVSSLLVAGVPVAAWFVFENVSQEAGVATLLELPCFVRVGGGNNNVEVDAQLRNIPITKQ